MSDKIIYRLVLGLVISPAIAPLIFILAFTIAYGWETAMGAAILETIYAVMWCAYGSTILLVLPFHMWLSKLGQQRFNYYVVLGLAIGCVLAAIISMLSASFTVILNLLLVFVGGAVTVLFWLLVVFDFAESKSKRAKRKQRLLHRHT